MHADICSPSDLNEIWHLHVQRCPAFSVKMIKYSWALPIKTEARWDRKKIMDAVWTHGSRKPNDVMQNDTCVREEISFFLSSNMNKEWCTCVCVWEKRRQTSARQLLGWRIFGGLWFLHRGQMRAKLSSGNKTRKATTVRRNLSGRNWTVKHTTLSNRFTHKHKV